MLKFKKHSKIIIACTVVLVLALSAGLMMNSSAAQGGDTTTGDAEENIAQDLAVPEPTEESDEVSIVYGLVPPPELTEESDEESIAQDLAVPELTEEPDEVSMVLQGLTAPPELTEESDNEDFATWTWEEELRLIIDNEIARWREMSDAAEEMSLHIEFPTFSSEIIVDTREYFLWTPEGYEHDEALDIVFSLPLPAANWQIEEVRIGDTFLDYGPHVYSIRIIYTIPESRIGLSPHAHGNLLEIAAYLFERFSDLKMVSFNSTGGDWVDIRRGE